VSSFGIYQQSGNVLEWCEDRFDGEAYQRYVKGDFSPPKKGASRVLRGGSWIFDLPGDFRGAARYNFGVNRI
jgi:formylglycine-generating enzyme